MIICDFNMFDLKQKVFINPESGEDEPIEIETLTFSESVAALCEKYETSAVHLYGNEKYLKNIVEDMKKTTTYNKMKIEVEIN